MDKSIRRFLWGLLGIVLLFLGIQNFEAVSVGMKKLAGLVMPLFYGCAIAFILNLIVRLLERFLTFGPFRNQKFRRVVTIFLSLLLLTAVVAGLVAGVVPEVRASANLMVEKLPRMIDSIVNFCVERLSMPASWFTDLQQLDVSSLVQTMLQSGMIQKVLTSGGNLVGGVVTGLFEILIGLCFSFYILMQKEDLSRDLKRLSKAYLKPATHEKVLHVFSSMYEIYSSFISGQCLDAVILGIMVTVTLWIFGIDYALLIGILVAFTALIPVVGAFLGGAVGVFLLIMVSVKDALIFLVAFLVLQQIDNRLIYPHVVGSAVGLPAIWIFAAIVVGGNLGGIFGMIFAIPLFALVYSLLSEDLHKREKAMEEPKEE